MFRGSLYSYPHDEGGFGRDFSASLLNPARGPRHPARGAIPGEAIIRASSRLGLAHPARSKTISSLGLTGDTLNPITTPCASGGGGGGGTTSGAVCKSPITSEPKRGGVVMKKAPGLTNSRTLDLSHHLQKSSTESREASPGSLSPLEQRGPDMIRQSRKYSSGGESDEDRSDQEKKSFMKPPSVDARRSVGSGNEEDSRKTIRSSLASALPPLSPKAASEVKSERDRGYDERRKRRESDPLTPRGDSLKGEEQKSPRGLSPIRSPRRSGSAKPRAASPGTTNDATWPGWNQSKERDMEDDNGTSVRLPPSPRGSLVRRTSSAEEDGEGKCRPQGECKPPSSPRLCEHSSSVLDIAEKYFGTEASGSWELREMPNCMNRLVYSRVGRQSHVCKHFFLNNYGSYSVPKLKLPMLMSYRERLLYVCSFQVY